MPFAETWMELGILILSEVSEGERQIPYDVICVWNLKYGTSDPIFKTETDIENRLVVAKGRGWRRDGVGGCGWQMQTTVHGGDKQGPTVSHRELYSMFCDKTITEKNIKRRVYV